MTKKDIAHEISLDLLGADVLDRHNFDYDDDAVIDYVQQIIFDHLRDYVIVSGTII